MGGQKLEGTILRSRNHRTPTRDHVQKMLTPFIFSRPQMLMLSYAENFDETGLRTGSTRLKGALLRPLDVPVITGRIIVWPKLTSLCAYDMRELDNSNINGAARVVHPLTHRDFRADVRGGDA